MVVTEDTKLEEEIAVRSPNIGTVVMLDVMPEERTVRSRDGGIMVRLDVTLKETPGVMLEHDLLPVEGAVPDEVEGSLGVRLVGVIPVRNPDRRLDETSEEMQDVKVERVTLVTSLGMLLEDLPNVRQVMMIQSPKRPPRRPQLNLQRR